MNLVDKRPRINYFNCAEFVYEDPQRKESNNLTKKSLLPFFFLISKA